jgi:hypothetical protein
LKGYLNSYKLKAQGKWEGEDKAGDKTNETGIAADTGTSGKQEENMAANKTIKTIDTGKAEKQEQRESRKENPISLRNQRLRNQKVLLPQQFPF